MAKKRRSGGSKGGFGSLNPKRIAMLAMLGLGAGFVASKVAPGPELVASGLLGIFVGGAPGAIAGAAYPEVAKFITSQGSASTGSTSSGGAP